MNNVHLVADGIILTTSTLQGMCLQSNDSVTESRIDGSLCGLEKYT